MPAPLRAGLSRAGRLAAQGLVLTAVVGGTVVYAQFNQQVTLVVDGRTQAVRAHLGTVAGLLSDEGITLTSHDLVAPSTSTALHDGDRVVVRYARLLTVTVDGKQEKYWTTETTVDRALTALGIRDDGAQLSASRSQQIGRAGLFMTVSTPKSITITADHSTHTMVSAAATVQDALNEQGVRLGADDKVSVVPTTPVVDGMVVVITRIIHKSVMVKESYQLPAIQNSSANQIVGTTTTSRAGTAGQRMATYDVVYADGKEVGRKLMTSNVQLKAVAAVVTVGTKAKPKVNSNLGGSVDSLNWTALAKCESGGNPKAVNAAGYYGLYQFSLSTWRTVGGSGNPTNASPSEQLMRAKMLYKRGGASQWGCGSKLFT